MSDTRSSTSITATMGFSSAVVAVLAASAVSYYYHSSSKKIDLNEASGSTNREIGTGNDPSDRLESWNKRWSTGKIAFHKTEVHASLQKYCDEYLLDGIIGGGGRILVPLCGKTVDMAFLARKRPVSEVVGIEGIPKAIEDFVQEQPEFEIKEVDAINGFSKWKGESITLLLGDFFNVSVEITGGTFDGVWDRGSLVAINPALREQYFDKIGELLSKPNGKYLIATVARPNNDTTTGPPFSIDETEICRLLGDRPWVDSIQLLDTHSFLGLEPWYKVIHTYFRFGNMQEQIYIVTTK
jgi:thiopurine S-methyltransferase